MSGEPTPLEAAEKLVPQIEAAADRIERDRELPTELAHALGDAGMFWLLVPRSLDGGELDLPTYLRVIQTLARADGSVGWCVNQGAVFATVTRHLAPDAARAIWAGPRDVIANGPPPPGRAVAVPGGFRLSGRWSFSSGCRHATWLAGMAVTEGGERPGELLSLLLPKAEAQLIDVWHVRGLAGTGSHDFVVDDRFVPSERAVSFRDPVREAGPLYRISLNLLFACGFAAVALGVARAALDDLYAICGGKVPRFTQTKTRERDAVQQAAAQAEATWRGAHGFLHRSAREIWDDLSQAGEPTLEQRVQLRLASTHAIREAARAADLAYDLAGTDAIYITGPIQRRFQDLHVITQHLQARRAHYETVGQFQLGHDPERWFL
jgi:alkylation response protein AidB-like acyl-CoA dehydrogenase